MFFLALVFNLLSSYFIASLGGHFLIMFVAFFALVVLNMEILSLFSAINELNVFIFSIINFCATFAVFKNKKTKFLKPSFDFKRFKNTLFLDKSLLFLLLAFVVMLLVSLFLALVMPVLEPDSQTYHFLRAYEFSVQGSFRHFETNDIRALIMPINSEILYSWLFVFKKNFHGYGIVSFCAFILIILSMWNISEKFKFSYRKRLFAIFIFSSFSNVIIQMPSLQTDLVVGSLLICAFSLFIFDKVYFSSLALALAMGTKSTGIMAILAFFVLIFLYEKLIEKNKKSLKTKKVALFLPLNFLIFSSYNYILNLIHFHNPLSNRAAYLSHGFWGGIRGYISNLIHFFFQSFDFTGFKWGYYLNNEILELKQKIFEFIKIPSYIGCNVEQHKVNILTDEQIMGFGVLGFLVFMPMLFVSLVKIFFKRNKKTIFNFILALAFIINILVLARATAYMVFSIRFVISFVVLSSLILISVYKKKSFMKPIIIFFCIFYMLFLPFHNQRMPFFKICDNLKKVNYNLVQFENDSYEGNLIPIYETAKRVHKTIFEKYSNKKNIAFVKKTTSSALYLKKLENDGVNVDFLSSSYLNNEKINTYDLIILEGEIQEDNVFNPWEIEKKYKVINGNVIFDSDDNLNCYWVYTLNKWEMYKENATERFCFTYPYLIKNKVFKLDFKDIIEFKTDFGDEKINLYYFINQNKY